MASSQVSSEFVWQAIKKGNAFSVRGPNNVWFSKEKGNLYSKHSYKYSGVANATTIDVDATGAHLHAAVTVTDGFSKKPKAGKRTVVKQVRTGARTRRRRCRGGAEGARFPPPRAGRGHPPPRAADEGGGRGARRPRPPRNRV